MTLHNILLVITVLAYGTAAQAWWCLGIKEDYHCERQGCIRTWYKAVAENGHGPVTETGGTGIGLSPSSLCGTYFDGIGTLNCHGDVNGNCVQNVASFAGYTCRTHCDNDDVCNRTPPWLPNEGWPRYGAVFARVWIRFKRLLKFSELANHEPALCGRYPEVKEDEERADVDLEGLCKIY
ncbi:hypothetical protein B0H34DRAFT_806843 [Crassisporium funariophilum]|nr:hypothetical protein B0H34DRAFT_806843 [Crassisporium funariophilum]